MEPVERNTAERTHRKESNIKFRFKEDYPKISVQYPSTQVEKSKYDKGIWAWMPRLGGRVRTLDEEIERSQSIKNSQEMAPLRIKMIATRDCVSHRLKKLKNQPKTCDMSVTVGGKEVKLHSMVLTLRSKKFWNDLAELKNSGQERDALQQLQDKLQMMLDVYPPNIVNDILSYLYLSKIEIKESNLFIIYRLAEDLNIKELKEFCVSGCLELLNYENALDFFEKINQISQEKDLSYCDLEHEIKNYILRNAREVFKAPRANFIKLSEEHVIKFLSSKKLNLFENEVCSLAIKWLCNQSDLNERTVKQIKKCIHLEHSTVKHIARLKDVYVGGNELFNIFEREIFISAVLALQDKTETKVEIRAARQLILPWIELNCDKDFKVSTSVSDPEKILFYWFCDIADTMKFEDLKIESPKFTSGAYEMKVSVEREKGHQLGIFAYAYPQGKLQDNEKIQINYELALINKNADDHLLMTGTSTFDSFDTKCQWGINLKDLMEDHGFLFTNPKTGAHSFLIQAHLSKPLKIEDKKM